jgi:hypothetical protein
MFWQDAYERAFEHEHVIVNRWLPAIQLIVHAVGMLSSRVQSLRVAFSFAAAATVFCASVFGSLLFERATGLVFALLLATNSFFVALSLAPYQELPFLGLAFAGLSFHWRRAGATDRWLATIAFNLACLTRYEAWELVLVLAVDELWKKRADIGKGVRAAMGLGARYGAAALGWLAALVMTSEGSRLLLQRPPHLREAPAHLGKYVYRIVWELGGCPARGSPWIGVVLAVLVAGLAIVGARTALRQPATRELHVKILAFVGLVSAVVILGDPYSVKNLRETFLPVAFALLYAAEGVRVVAARLAARLRAVGFRPSDPMAAAVFAGIVAVLSARNAAAFVRVSSEETGWRLPAAVGRRLAQAIAGRRDRVRVVSIAGNLETVVVATYAQVPVDSIDAMGGPLPANVTHVIFLPESAGSFSEQALLLEHRLEDGSLPADAERVEEATIWTLRAVGPSP